MVIGLSRITSISYYLVSVYNKLHIHEQGFQIKPAASGISINSGHLRRLLSFGFQLKKKFFFFFFFGENDPPDSWALKIPYLTH
jgi:hypothetical protein